MWIVCLFLYSILVSLQLYYTFQWFWCQELGISAPTVEWNNWSSNWAASLVLMDIACMPAWLYLFYAAFISSIPSLLLTFWAQSVDAVIWYFRKLIKFPHFYSEIGNGSWDSWFKPLLKQVIGQKQRICYVEDTASIGYF